MSNTTKQVGVPMELAEDIASILNDHDRKGLVVQLEELIDKAHSNDAGQGSKVADALEACEWPDTSIGNKAIILSAIQALRASELDNNALRAVVARQPAFVRALERFEAQDGTFVRLDDVLGGLAASGEADCTAAEDISAEVIALRCQLSELVSAVRSINFGPAHAVTLRSDDEPCYPQRHEWVVWILGLCDSMSPEFGRAGPGCDHLPAFAETVIAELQRFRSCEALTKGAEPDWNWFDTLAQLGLLQRPQNGGLMWELTAAGAALLNERSQAVTRGPARSLAAFNPVAPLPLAERAAFEAYRDRRNQLLEAEGHKPGSDWHVTQAHYATWEARGAAGNLCAPIPETSGMPEFGKRVLKKLRRFRDCAEDGQGADIGKKWFDALVHLGLLQRTQRSPAMWEITSEGDQLLDTQCSVENDA